jgi:hypothetical protein
VPGIVTMPGTALVGFTQRKTSGKIYLSAGDKVAQRLIVTVLEP